ncbi:MAG: translation initiation factor IF-2 subunit beta [Candidatus Micrarchaeia archaeon]
MNDDDYKKLLDAAFEKLPKLSIDVSDFKIPVVDSIMQGNKTTIRNLYSIADKARRDPKDIARYLSKELGVPASIEDQRLVLNGKFQSTDLNKKIEKYFNTYVICKECHKPDSHLEVAGRGMLTFVCEACGARYGLKSY